jgi:hypothetical protein
MDLRRHESGRDHVLSRFADTGAQRRGDLCVSIGIRNSAACPSAITKREEETKKARAKRTSI